MSEENEIGTIGNYYGGLLVKSDGGKFFWGVEAPFESTRWEEIPKSLYTALLSFEKKRKKSGQQTTETHAP